MNKQMKKVVLSVAALAMGLSITACTQPGTMNQKANRTGQDVRQLARDVNPMATDGHMNNMGTHNRYGNYNAQSYDGMYNNSYNRTYGTAGTTNLQQHSQTMKQIADQAKKVQGVTKAVAVVHNNDVIVGIETNNKNTAGIEKNVRNQLQKKYPSYKFHITSDKKLNERVNGLYTRYTTNMGTMSNYSTTNTGTMNNYSNGYTNNAQGYGHGTYGMNNMHGYDYGTYGTQHPIRTLADDVGILIRDIGNAVTAPFR